MKLFGLEISRASQTKALSPPLESRWGGWGGGWFPVIREAFPGAWQRNLIIDRETALSFHAVWTCVTLIAHDISKLRIKLIELQPTGVWSETTNSAYSPVLRDPNPYQNDHQFIESWVLSKLIHGTTFVLKRRHGGGGISDLFILDATRTKPLVADDGSVFYDLQSDNLSDIADHIVVPARDIIHDRWNCSSGAGDPADISRLLS
jgi:HK97 family phage portal protein